MEISNKIKALRNEKGITQEELGKALKVSTQAVSKWECGGLPDLELIPEIAKYFNVTTDYLFGLPVNDYKDMEQKIVNYFASNKDSKELFFKMYKLGFYMELGAFKEEDVSEIDFKEVLENHNYNSQYINEDGIALTQIKKNKPFFAVFPKPICGNYNKLLSTKKKQIAFLKELGKQDFYDALILINSMKNSRFTPGLFVENLNISFERASEIIDILNKNSLVTVQDLNLDGKTIKTYALYNNPAIIGFLTFLDMIVERPTCLYYSVSNNDSEYFARKDKLR